MGFTRAAVAAILVGFGAVGCGRLGFRGGSDGAISRSRYIAAVVALRRVEGPPGDSVAFRARRDSVLREQGVTAAELTRFVQVHGGDIPYMSAVWDTIEARLKSPAPGTPARPGAPSTGPADTRS